MYVVQYDCVTMACFPVVLLQLMDDLEAVMHAKQVKVHSPLELSANGE